MKNKSLYHSTLLRLHFSLDKFHGMFLVKGGRPLVNVLKGLLIMAGANITPGLIRYICHFIVTCRHILRTQGVKGLTKYLKAAGVSLQQALGSHRVHDAGKLGARISRTRTGLPTFIPQHIRMRIRSGDLVAIRCTTTLLRIYAVFTFPGTLKLSTITAPSTGHGGLNSNIRSYIPLFVKLFVWERFAPSRIASLLMQYSKTSVFAMFKGGPGVRGVFGEWNTMPIILLRSIIAIRQNGVLWEALSGLLNLLDYSKIKFGIRVAESVVNLSVNGDSVVKPLPYLGKLGIKEEAAGKVRVFAMVDAWSQWTLYPYHRVIFDILKGVPMDGTFDQVAPLAFVRSNKGLWSLDLSAATDRLALSLQKDLLGAIFGYEFAGHWANLLTARAYRLHRKDGFDDLRYEVGQPMGALSSWASLAITHHFIVQVAAWRAGFPTWKLYNNYAVLGDDIVIGDSRVTAQYLEVMKSLGVECGLAKSLLSPKGTALEFAKRTIYKGEDVSPVALKEFFAASRHLGAFVELMRKRNISFAKALQAFGAGWKVRSWLNKPLGKLSSRIRLLILAINVPRSPDQVIPFFKMGSAPVQQFANDTKEIIIKFVDLEIRRMKTSVLTTSNQVVKFSANEWGAETAVSLIALNYGLTPDSLRAAVKAGTIPKGDLVYFKRLLSDALTNVTNLIWHEAKVENVAEAAALLKRLKNVPTDDFVALYMEFLELQSEVAKRSYHTFATIRPNPPEVKGLLTPSQVRIWKRWSQILQGSVSIK